MNVLLSLNDKWYNVFVSQFYRPLILLDFKSLRVHCEKNNALTLWLPSPRTNIDLITSCINFYFEEWPETNTLGQVLASCTILYDSSNSAVSETTACILFLRGVLLEELLIYVPDRLSLVLRELKYKMHGRTSRGPCIICFEDDRLLYQVHDTIPLHEFCLQCIMKLQDQSCPLCRLPLLS